MIGQPVLRVGAKETSKISSYLISDQISEPSPVPDPSGGNVKAFPNPSESH